MPPARLWLLAALLALATLTAAEAAPEPQLLWMYDLPPAVAIAASRDLGLNTLYLPTVNEVEALQATRKLVRAAHQAGLQVILALPTFSTVGRPPDPDNAEYRQEVTTRVRAVVRQLGDEPGVTAWAVADYVEREIRYTAAGFQEFLRRRYPSLEALNAAWGSQFTTWPQITLAQARTLDEKLPYQVGRPSVEVADYQADALRRLLEFWGQQVRGVDAERPLCTGRLAMYRSLVSVPDEYTYVVPELPVDVAEADEQTQNVQAVDLARQGGAFRVIPSLRVPVPPEPHYRQGATLGRWLREAALHGARGVALDGWARLAGGVTPAPVRETLRAQVQSVAGSFAVQPRAALAVLYEPYAAGFEVGGLPLHGYLPGLVSGEPGLLLWALRLGSKFGVVDYLSAERLVSTDLDRYSAVLAPTALKLPAEVQGKLRGFVERGGRLVCDLGAGMYETGSWLTLPPDLARMCGVAQLSDLTDRAGNLTCSARSPMFPSLIPPLTSRGLPPPQAPKPESATAPQQQTETPGDQQAWTLVGPMALATLSSEARAVLIASAEPKTDQQPARFAGLVAQRYGLGWAAFCTGSLWARWDPADLLFAGVHGDLWAPRARYALDQPGVWPQAVELCAEEDGVSLLNVGERALPVVVLAGLAEPEADFAPCLHQGAINRLLNAARPGVPPAAAVTLLAELPPGSLTRLVRRPVRLAVSSPEAGAELQEYGPQRVVLELAGPGTNLAEPQDRWWMLNAIRLPAQVRVRLEPGEYAVEPLSRHRVWIITGGREPEERVLTADEQGRLSVEVTAARARVEIEPAAPEPALSAGGAS